MSERGPRQSRHERMMISVSLSTATLIVVVMIFVGVGLGRAIPSGSASASDDADATATRQAELDELNRLRTQVAQTVICTPPPSPTPTETPLPTATPTPVPPVAMGTELAYADDWTVVVTGFTPAPNPDVAPRGRYLQVGVTVTNSAAEKRVFPFNDWVLVDATGRVFEMAGNATTQLYGPGWYLSVDPSLATPFHIVFDVAIDAGTAFILESKTDPMFRVAVQLQVLG